jgi:hypothetical protein
MIYYHDIFDGKETFLNGATTYASDFKRVVLPELQLIDTGATDIDYCIGSGESWAIRQTPNGRKHVAEWHLNYDFSSVVRPQWSVGIDGLIVHTREAETYFNSLNVPGLYVYFIKQSVDLNVLPTPTNRQSNKWVYLGNLNTQEMIDEYGKMKQRLTNLLNKVSFGQVDDAGNVMTHDQCLAFATEFSGGAGVGRAVLELLGMGLKCMVVGRQYGGPVRNDTDLIAHLEHNCNSSFSTSTGNLNNDYAQLVAGGVITKSLIDMNVRKSDYVAVINDILSH